MIVYRGEYKDIETNLANTNIQVTKRIDIIDAGGNNPYNIRYTEAPGAAGFTIFTFLYDGQPPATSLSVIITYSSDGGITWASQTFFYTSPVNITLPNGTYIFTFTITTQAGNNVYYSFEEHVFDLEMTDSPCRIIIIDNDEDKFTPIRAKQAEIEIYSSDTISINTFSQGADDRFRVNYYINSVLNFTGFLSLGDLSQEFLPDPNVIKLIATDGLGFLNDIPLTDFEGDNPVSENRIIDYLKIALSKTGLKLNIAATFNIREQTASTLNADTNGDGHFFNFIYLDAKTFEAEVGECENCYGVISKIIGEEAFLFQHLGEWRIVRIDEMEYGINQNVYRWSWDGTFINKVVETHEKNIGVGEAYSWMNDDCLLLNERMVKESRLTYKYETPKEIPCNVDFERGAVIDDSSPTVKTYQLECWALLKDLQPPSHQIPATNNQAYIKRIFINDYETERYVVITYPAFPNPSRLESEAIPVSAKDKFIFGYDFKFDSDVSGGAFNLLLCHVRLEGDAGAVYFLDDDGKWYLSNSTWSVNLKTIQTSLNRDDSEWSSVGGSGFVIDPVPVSGKIIFAIYWGNESQLASRQLHLSKFSFDYIPFINGSYQKYTGQKHTVAQTISTRNVRDKQVYISDSPKKLFKGALLIYGGSTFPLAGLFYNAAAEPAGVVNAKPYGEIQAFDVWNQYNRTMVKFDGTIDHSNPAPDLINKYFMTDVHNNTTGRIFLLLHYELDTHLCEWQAFFIEVSNEHILKQYTGNSFKYLTK